LGVFSGFIRSQRFLSLSSGPVNALAKYVAIEAGGYDKVINDKFEERTLSWEE
jgi:hypothetical protein